MLILILYADCIVCHPSSTKGPGITKDALLNDA